MISPLEPGSINRTLTENQYKFKWNLEEGRIPKIKKAFQVENLKRPDISMG
jgi:hypothetical protein